MKIRTDNPLHIQAQRDFHKVNQHWPPPLPIKTVSLHTFTKRPKQHYIQHIHLFHWLLIVLKTNAIGLWIPTKLTALNYNAVREKILWNPYSDSVDGVFILPSNFKKNQRKMKTLTNSSISNCVITYTTWFYFSLYQLLTCSSFHVFKFFAKTSQNPWILQWIYLIDDIMLTYGFGFVCTQNDSAIVCNTREGIKKNRTHTKKHTHTQNET